MDSISKIDDNNQIPTVAPGRDQLLSKQTHLEHVKDAKDLHEVKTPEKSEELSGDHVVIRDPKKAQADIIANARTGFEEVTNEEQAEHLVAKMKEYLSNNPEIASSAQDKIPREALLGLLD